MLTKVVLLLVLADTGGHHVEKRVHFNNLQECTQTLKETKIVAVQPSTADDHTWVSAATCGYEE